MNPAHSTGGSSTSREFMGIAINFDTLRTVAHGSISGSYAAVGTALGFPSNAMRIINNTDGDMFFSDDGTNDKLFVPAGSFVLYDISSNKNSPGDALLIRAGTTFYVKQSTAATKNSVYIEILYQN